jgi:hypothetical protein
MFGFSYGFAETVQFPDTVINNKILGGDILLVQMKDYVVISGDESQALEAELGPHTKKQFTRDIVMNESVEKLIIKYNYENKLPTVQKILARYHQVLAKIESQQHTLK